MLTFIRPVAFQDLKAAARFTEFKISVIRHSTKFAIMKLSCHRAEIITIHHHQTICMRGEDVLDKIGCFLKHCCYLLLDLIDSFWILLTCYNWYYTKKTPFYKAIY